MSPATVAGVVADGLARAGVARVFDATGGAHPLAAAARTRGLPVVGAGSVEAACVMAAVTGELTDAPGAALVGLDAGVASVVDAVALADAGVQTALLVVAAPHDDAALLAPAVKGIVTVEAASAAHGIAHASQLALTDPRGPVLLVLDVTVAARSAVPVATACRPAGALAPPPEALDAVGAAIAAAARPAVLAGRQCDTAVAPWLRAFAEAVPAPIVTTPAARGALPEPHPLALGVLGAPGAATLLERADLVIALGVNDVELWPGAVPAGVPVLRLARQPSAAPPRPVVEVTGDLALLLEELAPRLRRREPADWDVAELDRLKRSARAPGPPGFTARRVVELVREAMPPGTIATADVPAAAWWQAVAPHQLFVAANRAASGFALLAGVGARLAHPDRYVACFTTPHGVARHAPALAAATAALTRAAPLVAVVLAPPDAAEEGRPAAVAGWRRLEARDEPGLARALERAVPTCEPSVVLARVVR